VSKYPQHLWDEARESIEGGEFVNAAAKRLGINRSTLRRRIKLEQWRVPDEDERAELQAEREAEDHGVSSTGMVIKPGSEIDRLIDLHRREWTDVEDIRKQAVVAFKDDKFRPADAGDKWSAKDRLQYAAKLFSMYNTASNALMVSQEAQRRAHGFDYREQMKKAKAEGADQANQAALMDRLMASLETITNGKIIDGEWYENTHDGAGAGADQAPVPEGPPAVSDLGKDWPVEHDGGQDPRA
jgi:transposase-like protein